MPMRRLPRWPWVMGASLASIGRVGQHPLGQDEQLPARLRHSQAAPLAQPDGRAQVLFELAHAVAQGRLGDAQALCRCRQGTVLLDRLHDGQMNALQDHEQK